MTTTTITLVSEDTPFLLEVITGDTAKNAANERHRNGGLFFCEVCEIAESELIARGVVQEEVSGTIWCLHCFFDPVNSWQFIARGDEVEQLSAEPKGTHRATGNH